MTAKSVEYRGNLSSTWNTNRGPSPNIWADCPVARILENPMFGMHFYDDFLVSGNVDMTSEVKGSIGQWSVHGDAGAITGDAALEGGVIKLSVNASNEDMTMLSSSGAFRIVTTSTLALNGKLWFEARIAKSLVTTAHITCAVGLMTPQLTSGLPTTAQPLSDTDDAIATTMDFFGFILSGSTGTRGGPTEVGAAFELTSGTVNYPTGCTAMMAATGQTVLAADTYVKVGFLFDPFALPQRVVTATARQTVGQVVRPLIRFFINGKENPTFLSSADVQNATATQAFPTGFMCPVIAVNGLATVDTGNADYLACDWIRVAQLANS